MSRLFILVITLLILSADFGQAEEADGLSDDQTQVTCVSVLVEAEYFVERLAKMTLRQNKGRKYKKLFGRAQTALTLSAGDLQEAVDLQVLMLQFAKHEGELTETPIVQGKVKAGDQKYIEIAYHYARENVLSIQPAFLKAIQERRVDVIRGFFILTQNADELCDSHPGISSFCKKLDLTVGWQNKNYLIEAASTSLTIALFLVANGAIAPFADLAKVPLGADIALALIAKGRVPKFSEAILFQDDRVALEYLKMVQPFSIDELAIALKEDRYMIFKEGLRIHPKLSTSLSSDFLADAISNHQLDFFNLILEARPELAHGLNSKNIFAIHTAVAVNNIEAFKILLEKYGVDPSASGVIGELTYGNLSLVNSANFPDAVALKMLLADKRINVQQSYPSGTNALHWAVYTFGRLGSSYSEDAIGELILAGINVNAITAREFNFTLDPTNTAEVTKVTGKWSPLGILDYYLDHMGDTWSEPQKTIRQAALLRLRQILRQNGAESVRPE